MKIFSNKQLNEIHIDINIEYSYEIVRELILSSNFNLDDEIPMFYIAPGIVDNNAISKFTNFVHNIQGFIGDQKIKDVHIEFSQKSKDSAYISFLSKNRKTKFSITVRISGNDMGNTDKYYKHAENTAKKQFRTNNWTLESITISNGDTFQKYKTYADVLYAIRDIVIEYNK